MSKKSKGINPELERAIEKLIKDVMDDPTASLTDKCKILDRSINVEKLKQRVSDDSWGEGFLTPDDEDE